MQTLQQRLVAYCQNNKKEMPYGMHLHALSSMIIDKIKEQGKYDLVKKRQECYPVNSYPQALVPIVDSVIEQFFVNRSSVVYAKKTRYFEYEVDSYKIPAFEAALKFVGFEICQNFNKEGVAQYKVDVQSPSRLVKLGKRFHKELMIMFKGQGRKIIVDHHPTIEPSQPKQERMFEHEAMYDGEVWVQIKKSRYNKDLEDAFNAGATQIRVGPFDLWQSKYKTFQDYLNSIKPK